MATSPDLALDPMQGVMPDAADLLAQLGDGDPRMAALCKFFVQRQSAVATDAAAEIVERGEPAIDPAAHQALETEYARLRGILAAMRRDLRILRDHNALAAAALGACEACWGRNAACPHCGGRGRPGADSPDAVLYARLVAPAVRRLRRDEGLPATPATSFHPDRAAGSSVAGSLD